MFANCSKKQNKVLKCIFKSSWVLGFAKYWGLRKKKNPPRVGKYTITLKCTISKVPTSARGPLSGKPMTSASMLYCASLESYIRQNFGFFPLLTRIVCCLADARQQKAAALAWINQLLNFVQFDHKWHPSSVMTRSQVYDRFLYFLICLMEFTWDHDMEIGKK